MGRTKKNGDPNEPGIHTTRRRRRSNQGPRFSIYVYKVLKQIHPGLSMTNKAMRVMDDFMLDIYSRLVEEAAGLVKFSKRSTLSASEFQTATRLILPGELAKHAVSDATKAVANFLRSKDEDAMRPRIHRIVGRDSTGTSANAEPVEIEIFGAMPNGHREEEEPMEEEFQPPSSSSRRQSIDEKKDEEMEIERRKEVNNNESRNEPPAVNLVFEPEENITDEEDSLRDLKEPAPPTPPTEEESDNSIVVPPKEPEQPTAGPSSEPEEEADTVLMDLTSQEEEAETVPVESQSSEISVRVSQEPETVPMDTQSTQDIKNPETDPIVNVHVEVNKSGKPLVHTNIAVFDDSGFPSDKTESSVTSDSSSPNVTVTVDKDDSGQPDSQLSLQSDKDVSSSENSTVSESSEEVLEALVSVKCTTQVTTTRKILVTHERREISEWYEPGSDSPD